MSEFDYDEFEYTPVAAPDPVKKPGVARSIADTGLSLARGVVTGGKMISDVAGAGNTVSNTLSNTAKSIGDLRSDYSKNLDTIASQRTKAAEDSGSTWEELKAGAQNFADRPIDMIAEGIGSSVPTLAVVAATRGRVNPFAAGMGAVQGVGEVKGEIYEGVKNAVGEERAKEAQSYIGPNAGQIALGAGLGAVAGSTGIEPAVGRMLGGTAKRGIKPILANTISEGATEFAQGGQSKLATNVALQNEGIATPTWQGVAGQGIQEALAGAGSGTAFGVAEQLAPRQVEPQVTPEVQRQAEIEQVASTGPLGRAVATGMQEGVVPTPTEQQVMEEQARQQAINAISGRDFKGYAPSIEQQNQAEINAAEREGAFNTDTNILRQAVEARNQRLINMAEKRGAFESTWDKLEPAQREEMALQAGVPPIVAKAQSGREWKTVSESAKKPIINIFGERNVLQEQAPETAEEVIQEPATSTDRARIEHGPATSTETPAGQPAATTETTPATPLPESGASSQVTQQEPASLPVEGADTTKAEDAIRSAVESVQGRVIGSWYPVTVAHGGREQQFLSNIKRVVSDGKGPQAIHLMQIKDGRLIAGNPIQPLVYGYKLTRNNELIEEGIPRPASDAEAKRWRRYFATQTTRELVAPKLEKPVTQAAPASLPVDSADTQNIGDANDAEVVTPSGEVQRADNEGSEVSGAAGGNGKRAERSQGAGRTEPGDGTAVPMGTAVQGDTALADSVIQQETIALTRRRAAANETGLDATLSKAINKAKELIGRGHGESGALTSAWFNKAAKKFETARDNETAAHLRKIASRIKEIQAAKPINPPTEAAVQEPAPAIETGAPAVAAGVQDEILERAKGKTVKLKAIVKETGQINEGTFDAVEEITRIRKEIDALDALKTCLGG